MRLSFFCAAALFFSLQVFAAGSTRGQSLTDVKVTLSVQNVPLKTALRKLQDASGLSIFYPSNKVAPFQSVSLPAGTRSVADALNLLLENTGLDYQQDNGKVILFEKKANATPVSNRFEQARRVNGFVTDDNHQPLPGVTVRVKNSQRTSTATDANGHFHLDLENGDNVLIFSFIGYKTQEIAVGDRTSFEVTMQPVTGSLDEVQVIAYGTTTRRYNTGSVSSITSKDLGKETVNNPLTALQGRLPGVQITQDNGLPGSGVRTSIRGAGTGTISSAGFLPLYVIDGVPFTLFNGGVPATDNLNAYGVSGANGGVSPFSVIAPEDIERIDVLKDADATAIYGSRGANGVILITTKKGRAGRTTVNVNAYTGITQVNHYIPMMSTADYLAMRKAAYANANVTPTATNAPDLVTWSQTDNTDWQKYFIGHTAHNSNVNASVSGGDAQNSFLFTSTYRKDGTVYGNDFDATTFSGRLNASHKSANGRFSIDASANYSYMGTVLPNTDLSSLYNLPPNYPLYNANGSVNWTVTSPLSYYLQTTKAQTTNLLTNLNFSYKILPGLVARANLGYTLTRLKQQQANPASAQNPAFSNISTLNYTDNDNNNYIIEPQLEYQKNIGKGKLQALVGTTFQQTKATGLSLTGTGYSNEALIYSLTAASTVTTSYNNNSTYKYTAAFGRLNYNWEDKYIVDGTFRRDGSSRFGANNRFGNFGAVGASWIFTQEDFMKQFDVLSFGKLRTSYGLTGNDQIPDYQYYSLYGVGGSNTAYNGTPSLFPTNIANPDLKWETTKKLDIAAELGFLHDRILLKVDYYRNRTSNPLNYVPVPSQTGTTSYLGNLNATLQNKGWEFELNTINVASKDFRWNTSLNLTIRRNKLLAFPNLATSSYANTFIIGQPTDIVLLYHYTGPDPKTGLPTFQDKNGDGAITYANDRFVAPYGHPFYGGITNSFSYKGFQFDITFQYNHRYGYKNGTLSTNFNPYGYTFTNQSTEILNRWTQPGSTGYFPVASVNGSPLYSTLYSSDYNWGDASFVKLKTASMSYTLPKNWVNHLSMASASVYLQGQNLFTWAKQKYTYDPETAVPGTGSSLGTGQFMALPQLRTIVLGINCSF
ncbi:SusC/RagA family TonB-linked outer membrane protein [Mucilaginibacter sp. KACC 22063]|uniref:SusC/RagA family TonB-linked outer membrane protein n=1 Tax=Mucilaginibacter sp. KACC 22063 TaxID=3025666 RepID=UPI0023653DEE|nr:SusC/RagA family TonB-linked outer membrane protein [Mucilaginibacter sp. KACC 22063]WDF57408.1 SusC/RagA family TonB-linked outer membrane protein [Mucilaginibacter sp. KACC 22063]